MIRVITISIGVLMTGTALIAADKLDLSKLPPPSTRQGITYTTYIKPIFDHSCTKCHSGKKPKAHLDLSTLESALKGNKHGKVIKPGDSAQSKLVWRVAHLGKKDHWMPPVKNKAHIGPLTAQQIGLIRAWIDQGAR